jgi:hypothetical protein
MMCQTFLLAIKLNKNHKASAAITELPVCHALHKSAMARQRADVLWQRSGKR